MSKLDDFFDDDTEVKSKPKIKKQEIIEEKLTDINNDVVFGKLSARDKKLIQQYINGKSQNFEYLEKINKDLKNNYDKNCCYCMYLKYYFADGDTNMIEYMKYKKIIKKEC